MFEAVSSWNSRPQRSEVVLAHPAYTMDPAAETRDVRSNSGHFPALVVGYL